MLNKNFRSFCVFYEELRIVAFFFFFCSLNVYTVYP